MHADLSPTALLSALVALPSVNPALPGSTAHDDESLVGAHVLDHLRSFGIDADSQVVASGRANIVGHLPRGRHGRDGVVLLSAHMDTYPASVDQTEYEPTIDGATLIGRGSADAKGSLAAMVHAFVRAAGDERRRECYLAATVDEEHGLTGARALAMHGMRPDLAITGEPTQLVPIIGQKGIVRSTVTVTGTVMHAAHPRPGNALLDAGRLLLGIERFNDRLAAAHRSDHYSPAVVVPTNLTGEGAMNTTPGTVEVVFDARFPPGSEADRLLADLRDFLERHVTTSSAWELHAPSFVAPPNECPPDDPMVAELIECVRSTRGRCAPDRFAYGSEAGVLAGFSKASLVLGPGDPRFSHGPGEQVDLREVDQAAEIFHRLLVGVPD